MSNKPTKDTLYKLGIDVERYRLTLPAIAVANMILDECDEHDRLFSIAVDYLEELNYTLDDDLPDLDDQFEADILNYYTKRET
jgi:hypothetical protein